MSLESEFIKMLQGSEKIVIYGCGKVGKLVYRRLCFYGMEGGICSFAVTRLDKAKECEGIPIQELETLKASEDERSAMIIVAVNESLHSEMVQELHRCGFSSYLLVSDALAAEMNIRDRHPRNKLKLQLHLTEHCNLNCRGCYHFSSIAKEEFLDINDFKRDMERLGELFHGEMEEILLLGGEPLLHKDVDCFFTIAREYFSVGKIKILTNGILLAKQEPRFWNAVKATDSEVWVTKYPINFDYEMIEKEAKRNQCEIHYFNQEPVRTLGHQPLDVTGARDYKENFAGCYRANWCIMLDHGKLYPCIIPACVRHFNNFFEQKLEVTKDDYIDIYEEQYADEILKKLERPIPFCRYCNRDDVAVFGSIPWETTKKDIREWTE